MRDELSRAHVEAMTKLLSTEKPEVVFTHGPSTRTWTSGGKHADNSRLHGLPQMPAYFIFRSKQRQPISGFFPNTYVDISQLLEQKKNALLRSCEPKRSGIWKDHHEIITSWRGREAGVTARRLLSI